MNSYQVRGRRRNDFASRSLEVLAIAAEEYQRLMRVLDDDRLRTIARCKLEGHRNEEIADRLGLACRSTERKLQRIRQVWEAELGGGRGTRPS